MNYIDITDPVVIKFANNVGFSNSDSIVKKNITGVYPFFFDFDAKIASVGADPRNSVNVAQLEEEKANNKARGTITRIQIDFIGGHQIIDLQDIDPANQPTWVGGTQADLDQAVTDINASL